MILSVEAFKETLLFVFRLFPTFLSRYFGNGKGLES